LRPEQLSTGEPALAVDRLSVRLGHVEALRDITLAIPRGRSVAVLGPNGAGKSTLFRAILGLVPLAAGTISSASDRIAVMTQRLDLEPSFPVTVADVVRMGRYRDVGWVGRFTRRDREAVEASIERLGIGALAGRRFGAVSGGERQRALLAQADAQDADLLLLDEPFAGLDAPTADALRGLLRRWSGEGRTVLVSTHDLASALRDFDLVVCLNRELVWFGPPAGCGEEVLAQTFAGHVVRVGSLLVETEHRHERAG
jgi:ABC-type Mn2+/Zn2+ transport system ATPase subunit